MVRCKQKWRVGHEYYTEILRLTSVLIWTSLEPGSLPFSQANPFGLEELSLIFCEVIYNTRSDALGQWRHLQPSANEGNNAS